MRNSGVVFVSCLVGLAVLGSASAVIAQTDEELKQAQANDPVVITGPLTRSVDAVQAGSTVEQRRERQPAVAIIYDDGIVTAVPAITSLMYGNQFNSATGIPVVSHSVTRVSFYMMSAAGTDNVFVSVFGPVSGTTAPLHVSASVPLNNGPGTFNTVTFGPYTGAGSFLAGVWYIAGDTVGLGSGTVNGQGHHGMVINDIVGTGFQTIPSINALVGSSAAILPVELMEFTIE